MIDVCSRSVPAHRTAYIPVIRAWIKDTALPPTLLSTHTTQGKPPRCARSPHPVGGYNHVIQPATGNLVVNDQVGSLWHRNMANLP